MSESGSVLLLGAGELGMAVLRGWAKHGAPVGGTTLSVLLRPASLRAEEPAKRRVVAELDALGVRVVAGDIAESSAEELAEVFSRYETVISCTGFVGGSGTQRKLARAALGAQVRRYLPWQFGVDYDVIGRGSAQDLFDEQLDVRDMLRGQTETEWIIVSTGMFTSFLFEPAFGVVDLKAKRVRALGSFETAVTVTTAEDIGDLTAAILFAEPRLRNRIVYTAGETIRYDRLADLLESALGMKLERQEWTVARLRKELAAEPTDAMRKYRVVFAEGKGVSWPMAETFNARNGLRTQDVEGWLRLHLEEMLR